MNKFAVEGFCVNCRSPLKHCVAKSIWVCTNPDCNWGYDRLHFEDADNLRIFAGYVVNNDRTFYPAAPPAPRRTEKWAKKAYWYISENNAVAYSNTRADLLAAAPPGVKHD